LEKNIRIYCIQREKIISQFIKIIYYIAQPSFFKVLRKTLFFSTLFLFSFCANGKEIISPKESKRKKLIILSIDGFPGYYANPDSREWASLKSIPELASKSAFSNRVKSTFPTLTYPAHTTMITGVDPVQHGIYFNNPNDPDKVLNGDWYWYDEDIKVKTLFDYAKQSGLTTANLYWPVTVGADIDYSIPQFWKSKTEDDTKILTALSTKGLYRLLSDKTKSYVGEFSGDIEKVESAIALWELKKPDLMLVYTTDLDTYHHINGVSSREAFQKLKTIDRLINKLITKVDLYNRKDLAFMIVSDHGFKRVDSICYPNVVLLNNKLISKKTNKNIFQFKSLGGSAILLETKKGNTSIVNTEVLEKISNLISNSCQGVKVLLKHDETQMGKSGIFEMSKMVLYSESNIVFSESIKPKEEFKPTNHSYYNHGFMPMDQDMETISLFYTPDSSGSVINDLKDVLGQSCKWLELNCKEGERR
jgi:predicted AlkP superfamily pyrophosphatase or phosphodiesterase